MKVAIYCRLSEEDRNKQEQTNDSESIQNQKSMLLQYSLEHAWEVYNIYSDDDYAGADRNRPQFKKLLEDAQHHKFNIVLCKTQSRFTRELELVEKYIHTMFPIWGIRFVSIVDNADTNIKGNKKSRQINGLVNEWYLEDMSENIKSVLINRRKNGFHIGSFALYGYRKDPEQKGHLIIDDEAASVVREVFSLFAQGYGKTAIARMLNDRGIPNPTEYKRLNGLRYQQPEMENSKLWKYFAISNMLVNEIYIGNMVQGKYGSVSYKTKQNKPRPKDGWYIVNNTHEPIIDGELWDKVQSIIVDRAKPFITGEVGLFAKKARCINCGYTMRSVKSRGKHYLQCANRYVSKEACIGSFISVDKLEQAVIREINLMSKEYLNKDELQLKIELCNNLNEKKLSLEEELSAYTKKIDEYTKSIKVLYLDKVKGIITDNDYIEFSRDFTNQKNMLLNLSTQLEKQIESVSVKLQSGNDKHKLIEKYINLERLNRETVLEFIDHVKVGKCISQTNEVTIEIHWSF